MTEKINVFFHRLQKEFARLVDEYKLKQAEVKVTAKPLSPEDTIRSTKRQDYVLLKGKERLCRTVAGILFNPLYYHQQTAGRLF